MTNASGNNLGVVMTFGLNGYSTDTHNLGLLFDQAGLDTALIKTQRRERANVVRAMRELEVSGFVRNIVEAPDRAVFVLVDEEVTGDDPVYTVADRIVYDKAGKTVTCGSPGLQAKVDALLAQVRDGQSTSDIRQALVAALDKAHAVRLRPDGGAYFVLDASTDTCDNIATFVRGVGGWATLLPVVRTDASRAELFQAMERHMLEELALVEAEVQRAALRNGNGKVRPTTWDGLQRDVERVRCSLDLYLDNLGTRQERVTEQLTATLARIAALSENQQ